MSNTGFPEGVLPLGTLLPSHLHAPSPVTTSSELLLTTLLSTSIVTVLSVFSVFVSGVELPVAAASSHDFTASSGEHGGTSRSGLRESSKDKKLLRLDAVTGLSFNLGEEQLDSMDLFTIDVKEASGSDVDARCFPDVEGVDLTVEERLEELEGLEELLGVTVES